MKKLLSLFLILAMLLSLAGCTAYVEPELYDPYEEDRFINAETTGEDSDEVLDFTTDATEEESEITPTDTAPEEPTTEEFTTEEATRETTEEESTVPSETAPVIDENGTYTTKEDVALYLYTYHKLPSNFITKKEAQKLGWPGGNLEPYAPGKCIGGDRFGNYEELLPTNKNYTECDIDTLGAKRRGAKRIVFANDFSLIYYTDDHYESFTLLYGEE